MNRVAFIVALMVFAGSAIGETPTEPPPKEDTRFVYVPADNPEASRQAIKELKEQLDAQGGYGFYIGKHQLSSFVSDLTPIAWKWEDHGITVSKLNGDQEPLAFRYVDMPKLGVIQETRGLTSLYGVPVSENDAIWCKGSATKTRLACAKFLAESFSHFRVSLIQGRKAFEEKFSETLAKYPDPASRPPLPEEARRFKVQAEAAIKENRIKDALNLYNSALGIAPWWAEGFFNISLLFAEEKQYDSAIRNMKRYLLLLPSAPNARAAQDKIYEWELKFDK